MNNAENSPKLSGKDGPGKYDLDIVEMDNCAHLIIELPDYDNIPIVHHEILYTLGGLGRRASRSVTALNLSLYHHK